MWLFETVFWQVLTLLGKVFLIIGFIGMFIVGNDMDYNETVMNVFVGLIVAGALCFCAMALALVIAMWFFKEIK